MLNKNPVKFIFISSLVLALSACGGDDNKNPSNGKSSSSKAVSSSSKANSSVVTSTSSKANSSVAVSSSSKSNTSSKSSASSKAAAKNNGVTGKSSVFSFDFNLNIKDWKVGFADFPKGEEVFYELSFEQTLLPTELGDNTKGLKISGNNHSADLFMFATRKITGLLPNTRYDIAFDVTFGTNAAKNCVGLGGSPGESVTFKAGAINIEPKAEIKGSDTQYSMNIDKGNQSLSGSDAIALGHLANENECGSGNTLYMAKTVNNQNTTFSTTTDDKGSFWIILSTDSGYEASTSIYLMKATVTATTY